MKHYLHVCLVILSIASSVTSLDLYPYGPSHGDEVLPSTQSYAAMTLKMQLKIFSINVNRIFIGYQGIISFEKAVSSPQVLFPAQEKILSIYNLPYDRANLNFKVFYRETTNLSIMTRSSRDVEKSINGMLLFTHAVIVTYEAIGQKPGRNNTFQVVLAGNPSLTYAILSYDVLDETNAIAGYSDRSCHVKLFTSTTFSIQMSRTSNINEVGRHVHYIGDLGRCGNSGLHEHGKGEFVLPKGSGQSQKLALSKKMPIFMDEVDSTNNKSLFVNTNGAVSYLEPYNFEEKVGTLSVYSLQLSTATGSSVSYEETFDPNILLTSTIDVQTFDATYSNFTANHAVMVTYLDVPAIEDETKKHTFQMVIVSDGTNTFLIVQYVRLDKEAAVNAYFDKDKCVYDRFSSFSQSRELAHNTNTGIKGKFIFLLTPPNCRTQLFYKDSYNSERVYSTSKRFLLKTSVPLPKTFYKAVHVHPYGDLTGSSSLPPVINKDSSPPASTTVLPYQASREGGNANIFFSELYDNEQFLKANTDIEAFTGRPYNTTQLLIFTYLDMEGFAPYTRSSFQLVLATDEKVTYAILNYHRLDEMDANVGYAAAMCDWHIFVPRNESRMLAYTSNIGIKGRHVWLLKDDCIVDAMYRYGEEFGDRQGIPIDEGTDVKIELQSDMPLFSGGVAALHISTFGYISTKANLYQGHFSLPFNDDIIAVYNRASQFNKILIRPTTNGLILGTATDDVRRAYRNTDFTAIRALVITFIDNRADGPKNTVQLVLVSDNINTFGIFIYHRLDQNEGTAGFTKKMCNWDLLKDEQTAYELVSNHHLSNTGVTGRHVRLLNSKECKFHNLYGYGAQFDDIVVPVSYDNFPVAIKTRQPMKMFGESETSFYIYNNGFISIGSDIVQDVSSLERLQELTGIAIYFQQDGKTYLHSGTIYYAHFPIGASKLTDDIETNIRDYTKASFRASYILMITYKDLKTSASSSVNTFQILITSNGTTSYAVLNFVKLDSTSAYVGIANPKCSKSMIELKSRQELLEFNNNGNMGQHVIKLECQASDKEDKTDDEKESAVIGGVSGAGALLLILLAFAVTRMRKKQDNPQNENVEIEDVKSS